MFNIADIFKRNKETFYDQHTKEQQSVNKIMAIELFIALILAVFLCKFNSEMINAFLIVYSILIGFSFNILFYVLSIKSDEFNIATPSLERQLKIEKVNTLTREIFYNVSYFNMASIAMVLLSLLFFIIKSYDAIYWEMIVDTQAIKTIFSNIYPFGTLIKSSMVFAYKVLFYFVLLESMYSLIRTIGRVAFYFGKRVELQSTQEDRGQ